MTSAPAVSVVLAVHNGEEHLEAALDQLAALSHPDIEFVLVDDGSSDGTLNALRHAAASDARIRVVKIPTNGGLGAARRAGFTAARGRYIWNIDVDDQWPPDAVTRLVEAADGDADLVLAAATRRKPSGDHPLVAPLSDLSDGRAFSLLLQGAVTGHLWNKLIRTTLLTEDVYTDARLHSDLIMCARILSRARTVRVEHRSVYTYLEAAGSSIRSPRPRGDSLAVARGAVRDAAAGLPLGQVEPGLLRRFEHEYLVLSELRDAVRADYELSESLDRLNAARARISLGTVTSLLFAGRPKPAVLLAVALVSPAGFRKLMSR